MVFKIGDNLGKKNINWKGGISKDKKSYWKFYFSDLQKRKQIKERQIRWYQENKKRVLSQKRKWKKINIQKYLHSKRLRKYREKGAKGKHTLQEWEELKKQYNWTCPDCGKKEPDIKLTEDHIIPISRGGSNWIENIQPLCKSCNSKKHNKLT